MIPDLGNDYIAEAIDSLEATVGLKDRVSLGFLHDNNEKKCVENISRHLGLPIEINLIYVPDTYSPLNTVNFHSKDVVLAESGKNRGGSGIVAQVSIPPSLPMYGSKALDGYRIDVRVNKGATKRPATFVTLMAHELSHVLLYALRHPEKENEIYTDLVPLMLGLDGIVGYGRKVSNTVTNGNVQTTTTTTYGYLTGQQYLSAVSLILRKRKAHAEARKKVSRNAKSTQRKVAALSGKLTRIEKTIRFLDKKQPRRVQPEDARRIVDFHRPGYAEDWNQLLNVVSADLERISGCLRDLNHYSRRSLQETEKMDATLQSYAEKLQSADTAITSDRQLLAKYAPLLLKIR
jgi:hypothetical protein